MARRNEPRRVVRAIAGALIALGAVAPAVRAQESWFRRLNLDKLEIASLGAGIGRIVPSQLVPTNLYYLQGDYGNITPAWRVTFGVSYWESRFEDEVVQAFADSLHKSLTDSTAQVRPSIVRIYDVAFNADARYSPLYGGWVKPFLGVGIAAHVLNAEGDLIKGTFVERALDDIAAGLYVTGGVTLQVVPHFQIEGSARGDLLSGFRSTQVRAGVAYVLGHARSTARGDSPGRENGQDAHERGRNE